MDLTPEQKDAVDKCLDWYRNSDEQIFRIFGYAGTGKTTLAKYIEELLVKEFDAYVLWAAYTGKAAHVLRTKGVDASTIHSLVYHLEKVDGKKLIWRINDKDSPLLRANLLAVDEVSMVNEENGKDLLSFGKKVLVLGDPGQLPPVSGTGFFTDAFPDVLLSQVHRQAEGSPIIQLATQIRQGELPKVGTYGESSVQWGMSRDLVMGADQLIVGRNVTRKSSNYRARALKNMTHVLPQPGDKLVCLRNDRKSGVANGTIWWVDAINTEYMGLPDDFLPTAMVCDIHSDDDPDDTRKGIQIHKGHFVGEEIPPSEVRLANEFDYGYALTCHKSQGSQWGHVVIYDESTVFRENQFRWLYTAVTRASQRVNICKT